MLVHVVLRGDGSLGGLFTCGTDAAEASKQLPGSVVVLCHLNALYGGS